VRSRGRERALRGSWRRRRCPLRNPLAPDLVPAARLLALADVPRAGGLGGRPAAARSPARGRSSRWGSAPSPRRFLSGRRPPGGGSLPASPVGRHPVALVSLPLTPPDRCPVSVVSFPLTPVFRLGFPPGEVLPGAPLLAGSGPTAACGGACALSSRGPRGGAVHTRSRLCRRGRAETVVVLARLDSDALVHARPSSALTARRFPDVDVSLVVAGGASVGHFGKPESNADALDALESSAVCEGELFS
jgi:hypothetical protein